MNVLLVLAFIAVATAAKQERAWRLADYKLCKQLQLPGFVGSQVSGATYIPSTGHWFLLSGDPGPALHELSPWPGLQILRSLSLTLKDPEAVVWIGGTTLAVTDERFGTVTLVDVQQTNNAAPGQAFVVSQLALPGFKYLDNKGLEGVAPLWSGSYGAAAPVSVLLLAQEQYPRRILELNMTSGAWREVFTLDNRTMTTNQTDGTRKKLKNLSDMFVTPDDRLFLLSKQSKTVAEVTMEGHLIQSRTVGLPAPEGLAFTPDGQYMMVASEGKSVSDNSSIALYALGGEC